MPVTFTPSTLTTSLSTPAASSEHYTQLTSGSGIGPEGGPVFAPPSPQPRIGGDQLDISKFNPGDPGHDRGSPAYIEMTRRWMEDQGDEYAENYAEYREQQAQQPTGESTWWYEAKRRGKQELLEATKQSNRRFTPWGAVFNLREVLPDGSLADNYLEAAEDMVAAAQLQGPLNAVNGLTDILVGGFNTSMYVMMGIPTTALTNLVNTAAGEAVLPTEFPQIPVVDYSQDAWVYEDPYWHGWSKGCAGTGITMLLPGGIAKHAGTALKGSSIGRMFTGVSKAQSGTVEAVVGQAKSLVPKSLGKVRLPRFVARPTQVAKGIGEAPAGVAPRGAARNLKLPQKGNLPPNVLGETDWAGNIRLRNNLSWAQQRETLIHEGVHRFFTAKNGPLVGFRQWLTKQGYTKSHFLRGVEEMLAQGYARYRVSGSFGKAIGEGIAFPFANGYVTPGRFFLEGGVAVGGTIYVGWWLQDWLFDE